MKLNSQTTDLLHLLANAVIADEVVRIIERNSFIEAVMKMSAKDASGKLLSEKSLSVWFNMNHAALFQKYAGDRHEIELAQLVTRMDDRKDHTEILAALKTIAESDGEFHKNEKILISLIETYWS